ncbi:MAG: hypothetical protein QGH25_14955, partial [Candidatus Latescibacteria bacterium]|nr:hypothetical protein [Candidatus Latescibacterota bacterium]
MVGIKGKILGIANSRSELAAVLRAMEGVGGDRAERLLVAGDSATAAAVPEGVQVRVLGDYPLEGDVQRKAILWLDDWSDEPLAEGLSFKEELACGDVSLWWFFLPVIFPDVMRCMQYVEQYRAVYAAEAPAAVVCADAEKRPMLPYRLNRAFDLPTRIAAMVARTRLLPVDVALGGWSYRRDFWRTYLARSVVAAAYRTVGRHLEWASRLWTARMARAARKSALRADPGSKKVAVFTTSAYWRRDGGARPDPGGEDVIVGRVVDRLVDAMGWQVVDIDTEVNIPSLDRLRRLWRKAQRGAVDCRSLESYCDRAVKSAATAGVCRLRQSWSRLRIARGFRDSLSYQDVPLWPLLAHRFDYLFAEYARIALLHLAAAERVLEVEKPDAIMIEYEEGSYGRAATVAARRRGTPS